MASMSGTRRRTTSASASRSPASRPAVEFGKSVTASSYSREVHSCPIPSSRSPVLHPQAGNPLEFSYVVRDECCAHGEGVGADQSIEGPDRSSELLEVAANLSVDSAAPSSKGRTLRRSAILSTARRALTGCWLFSAPYINSAIETAELATSSVQHLSKCAATSGGRRFRM